MKILSTKQRIGKIRITAIASACGAFALLGSLAVLSPAPARAQAAATVTNNKPVSVNAVNGDVRTILRSLFSSHGINSVIDQDVQGLVNVQLNDVSFDVALRQILNAVNPPLTFSIEAGVYHVKVKTNDYTNGMNPVPGGANPFAPPVAPTANALNYYRIPLDHMDPYLMAALIANGSPIVPVPSDSASGQSGNNGARGGMGGSFGGGMMGGMGGGMMGGMGGGMMGGGMGGGMMGGMGGGMMGGMGGGMGGGFGGGGRRY